jgi:hypothetical protein
MVACCPSAKNVHWLLAAAAAAAGVAVHRALPRRRRLVSPPRTPKHKFSKVSALVSLLYKGTAETTFENDSLDTTDVSDVSDLASALSCSLPSMAALGSSANPAPRPSAASVRTTLR